MVIRRMTLVQWCWCGRSVIGPIVVHCPIVLPYPPSLALICYKVRELLVLRMKRKTKNIIEALPSVGTRMAPGANRPRVVNGDGNSGLDDDGSWGAMYSSRIMAAYEKMGSSCTTSYPYPLLSIERISFWASSSSSSPSTSSSESDPSTQLKSLSSSPWSLLRKGLRERENCRGRTEDCSCGSCPTLPSASCCITSGSENSMDSEDGMYGLSPLRGRPSRCWRVFAIAVTAAVRVCSEEIPWLLLLLLLRSDRTTE